MSALNSSCLSTTAFQFPFQFPFSKPQSSNYLPQNYGARGCLWSMQTSRPVCIRSAKSRDFPSPALMVVLLLEGQPPPSCPNVLPFRAPPKPYSCSLPPLRVSSHWALCPHVSPVSLQDLEPWFRTAPSPWGLYGTAWYKENGWQALSKHRLNTTRSDKARAPRPLTCALRLFPSCLSWSSSETRRRGSDE